MAGIFSKLFSVAKNVLTTLGPVIDLMRKLDWTRLNDEDRSDLGVLAVELRQSAQSQIELADAIDAAKSGGLTGEEYELLALKLTKMLDELADIVPAAKRAVD